MSTGMALTTYIETAQRLDALVAAMSRARRMRDQWSADYDRDRHIAMALLHDLGLDAWDSDAGEFHVRVRRGELDYKTAYEALRAAVGDSLIVMANDSTGVTAAGTEVRSRLAQAMESTPERKPRVEALMRARAEEEKP